MSMVSNTDIPLYLFAKEPIAGKVKTRMRPHLSEQQCAELAGMMLAHSCQQVATHWPGRMILCVSPSVDAPIFTELAGKYRCDCELQVDANLGGRMRHVLQQGISQSGSAVVMGCDVPYIAAEVLVEAHRRMQQGVNVIGPALDGGFYLLGSDRIEAGMFESVEWGTSSVHKSVVKQSTNIGVGFHQLAVLRDIDRWPDLVWLAGRDSRYAGFTND